MKQIGVDDVISIYPQYDKRVLQELEYHPEDVSSPEQLVEALWRLYSARAGQRNWPRLRALFHPCAGYSVIVYPDAQSATSFAFLHGFEDYRNWCYEFVTNNDLFEYGIVKQVVRHGNLAHVWASVAISGEPNGRPWTRAMQSIRMIFDGKRWWIQTIAVDHETGDNPIPAEFESARA